MTNNKRKIEKVRKQLQESNKVVAKYPNRLKKWIREELKDLERQVREGMSSARGPNDVPNIAYLTPELDSSTEDFIIEISLESFDLDKLVRHDLSELQSGDFLFSVEDLNRGVRDDIEREIRKIGKEIGEVSVSTDFSVDPNRARGRDDSGEIRFKFDRLELSPEFTAVMLAGRKNGVPVGGVVFEEIGVPISF